MAKSTFRSISCRSARNHPPKASVLIHKGSALPSSPSSEVTSAVCPVSSVGMGPNFPSSTSQGPRSPRTTSVCLVLIVQHQGQHPHVADGSEPVEPTSTVCKGEIRFWSGGGAVERLLVSSAKFLETLWLSLSIRECGLHPQNHSNRQSLPYLSPSYTLKAVTQNGAADGSKGLSLKMSMGQGQF